MLKRLDQSEFLIKAINRVSEFLARQRGLPALVGVVLIIVAFILQLINVYAQLQWLEVLQIILHNVGLLSAVIGFLLVQPLGK